MDSFEDKTVPIVQTIDEVIKKVSGWSPADQLFALFNLAYLTGDLGGDILEVGSWCGRSSIILGLAARLTGNTRVHCVDLFPSKSDWYQNPDGTYSFSVLIDNVRHGAYQEQRVWKEPYEKDIAPLYEKADGIQEIFEANVKAFKLESLLYPFKGVSDTFAKRAPPGLTCRLAFLDGDHGYEAVCKDIQNAEKFLIKGGWICFDDAFSTYDGVNRAIKDRILQNPAYDQGQQLTRKFFAARRKK